jgi:hypothetical protein
MVDSKDTHSVLEDYLGIIRSSMTYVAKRIQRHFLSFLLIILLFGAGGVVLWYRQVAYYESELALFYNSKRVPRKTYGEMLHKLDQLAMSGSGKELGRQLGMSPELANSILRVEGKNRAGSPLHEDITEEFQAIYVAVKATDRRIFEPAEQGIINYLNISPYQKRISDLTVARIRIKIDFLNGDLRKTDSIIDAYTIALRNGVPLQDSIGERYNVQVLFDHKSGLEDNLLDQHLQLALEGGPSVSLTHGFAAPDRPDRGSKKPIIAMTILGLVVAFGFVVLKKEKQQVSL